MWSSDTGKCFHTFRGHTAEIVCLSFNPQSTLVATGSMDTTAKLWDIHSGHEVATLAVDHVITMFLCDPLLQGHSAEVICLSFNSVGESLLTGSFDHTVSIWDVATGK